MGIDPILYTIKLGSIQIPIRWYGLLIVIGALAAAFYASWYVKRKNQDPDIVWDALLWLLISGILGARVWYVVADIIGGSTRYLQNPLDIFKIWEGGLNILGGVVVAAVVGWYYCRRNGVDFWLIADAAGPALLLGQAVGRLGNYINQELYGPPTTLPWGIRIDAAHRIPPWTDITVYPVETTLFHPTFAYEMIWNLVWFGVIFWLVTNRESWMKPGVAAGMWLMIAGFGRVWIEFFRPDQPSFFGTPVSTSMVLSFIFGVVGLLIILAKTDKISLPFIQPANDDYQMAQHARRRPQRVR